MNETWIPWTVIAVLVAAGIVMVKLFLNHTAKLKQHVTDRQRENDQIRASLTGEHQKALGLAMNDHQAHALQLVQEKDQALALVEAYRRRAFIPVHGDLVSRSMILSTCRSLGLHGVLATNLQFIPVDSDPAAPYVAQIDHVLLTTDFAMIIENKYWTDVVFDGVHPSSVHSSFGILLGEEPLQEPFAVQINVAEKASSTLAVRTQSQGHSPRSQVRQHALKLQNILKDRGLHTPWFRTGVLYSHPNIRLYTTPLPPASNRLDTRVVSGMPQLHQMLAGVQRFERGRPESSTIDSIVPELATWGADVRGFGDYADLWPPLPHTE